MPFKLTVRCHGIFAAVEATDRDQVAVLMCQAARDVVTDQVAYVRFPTDSYSKSNQRKPVNAPGGINLQYVVLASERLTIVAETAPHHQGLVIFDERDPKPSRTPTAYDARSLAWMPKLDYLAGGAGAVNPAYFRTPLAATPRLLARVDFTQGWLGTSGVDSVQVPFRYEDPKNTYEERHPVARELLVELDIQGSSFTLHAESLDGASSEDMLFEPKGDLEIIIGNEARADIFTRNSPIEPIDVVAGKCMAEFKLYFSMCATPPLNPLLPFLTARPGSDTCCSGVHPPPSEDVKFQPQAAPKQAEETTPLLPWTALTYLAADNNLSTTALADLDELEQGDSEKIGVVVQVDRTNEDTEFLVLEKTGFRTETFDSNLNSGSVGVLTEFLRRGRAERPAANTAVFFPTHGGGLLNFAQKLVQDSADTDRLRVKELLRDASSMFTASGFATYAMSARKIAPDVTSRDFIDNGELLQALRAALGSNERFAVIGFDACVMGLVEIAYQVRLAGQYFVASQDDIRAEGWPYTRVLSRLAGNPTPADAAIAIVQEFNATVAGDKLATLSAVDLDAVMVLVRALDALGVVLLPMVPQIIVQLSRARDDARYFSNFHYIDLHGFVDAIGTRVGDWVPEVKNATNAVLTALANAVISTNTTSIPNGARGLSVYVPNSPVAPEYDTLLMSVDAKNWHNFVVAYTTYR